MNKGQNNNNRDTIENAAASKSVPGVKTAGIMTLSSRAVPSATDVGPAMGKQVDPKEPPSSPLVHAVQRGQDAAVGRDDSAICAHVADSDDQGGANQTPVSAPTTHLKGDLPSLDPKRDEKSATPNQAAQGNENVRRRLSLV